MKNKTIRIVKQDVEKRFLPFVRKPARYIGGEFNQSSKDLSAAGVRFALCFPDIYEIGMSHTGLAILYELLNRMPGVAAERVFAPWLEAQNVLRTEKIPLFSLESKAAVADFDFIGFSISNELSYSNVLNLLDLAGLEIRSKNRKETDPIIIAGGQVANCAEPMAEFIDLFFLGQAEEHLPQIIELYRDCKQQGKTKAEFLTDAARRFECLYVPSLYDVRYEDGSYAGLKPKIEDIAVRRSDAVVQDFENACAAERPIVPFVQAIHERISVEIMRGCPGRCRFCQASFCRRPIQYRSPDRILEIAKAQYAATAFDTISLPSLSTADYPYLEELIQKIQSHFEPLHVGISVPSLKVQQQLKLLPKLVASVRKSGLTIAVEAAGEKLRRIINKPITDEDLFAGVRAAYEAGFQKVKLYFMVGFPGETEEDIRRIVDLSLELAALRKSVDGRLASINAAVSWLVPKPHTPFGWLGQQSRQYFEAARKLILDRKWELNARCLQFKFHPIEGSVLESAMGRGDRRLADVIETAWRSGAKFDLWSECFDYRRWEEAFAQHGLNLDTAAQSPYQPGQPLPWSHLGGPREAYLAGHYQAAMADTNLSE